jgi:hypothetical protein
VFSYKATALFRRGYAGESEFSSRATRERDLLSLELRSGMMLRPGWLAVSERRPGSGGVGPPIPPRAISLGVVRRPPVRRLVHIAAAMTRDLVGDMIVLARIGIAACTGRQHPSARRDRLVSPFRSLRRGG